MSLEPEKFARPNGAEMPLPEVSPVHFAEEVTAVRTSPTLGKLAESLAKAQLDFDSITKDMENPAYARGAKKAKYADLHAFIGATRKQLASNGLVLMQFPHTNGDKAVTITSRLQHVSNEYIETDLKVSAVNQQGRFDIQTVGSAITYGRRYARGGILDIAAEEDDDGNAAAGVGTKEAQQDVARKQLEEKAQSPDPKIRQMAQDGLAAIRAKEQGKSGDLAGALQESIAVTQAQRKNNGVTQAHIPLEESLEAAKDDGLFDEVKGTVQQVRIMSTSAAKGNRPYRKVAIAVMKDGGEIVDMEISAFDNFPMSDGTCFGALDHPDTSGCGARLIVERNGKYFNLKDIKQLGKREWDARVGVVRRD